MKDRTRLKVTLVGFFGVLVTAWAKHWLTGISDALVITAAGIITGYIAGESYRASKPPNGQ